VASSGQPSRRLAAGRPYNPDKAASERSMPRHRSCATVHMMEPTSPWSQSFELRWRPCLDFYEHRVALLQSLKDRKLLRQFRVGDNQVSARLGGSRTLEISVEGMSLLDALGPIQDEEGLRLLMDVVNTLHPSVTRATSWCSHLLSIDWELDYEAACRRASSAVFGQLAEDASFTDFAILVDGLRDDLQFQAEFGVVSADEAPMRIARIIGNRIGGPEGHFVDAMFGRPYPSLGLFMDSQWTTLEGVPSWEDLPYWVVELGRRSENSATEVLTHVYRRVHRGAG
jgi:hypothetical protein